MMNIFLYALIIFFLSFGMIAFVNFICDFIFESKYLKNKTIYTVVPVCDECECVENIARAVDFKVEKSYSGVYNHKIVFLDKESGDGTYKILKRLEKSNDKICVVKQEELMKNNEFF